VSATPAANAAAFSSDATQLVVFRVAGSEFGLPVESVGEILRMVAIAPVPEAPEWLPGVINLRGKVIPVVDLRVRLGLPREAPRLNTPILVAEAGGQAVGLIADSVTELLTVPLDAVEPPDERVGEAGAVKAVARAGERLILIFDLERVCAGSQHLKDR
jgi:purine-binding chemotaxis protein CheW